MEKDELFPYSPKRAGNPSTRRLVQASRRVQSTFRLRMIDVSPNSCHSLSRLNPASYYRTPWPRPFNV